MSQTPSLYECFTWIQELCSNLLSTTNNTQYEEDPLVIIRSTRIFINALNAPTSIIQTYLSQLDQLNDLIEKSADLGTVVKEIQSICQACTPWLDPVSYVICKPLEGSTTSIYHIESPKIVPHTSASDYKRMLPDTFNYEASWFRQYFVGNPYITLIGPLNETKSSTFYSEDVWDNNELFINNNAANATITVVQENNKLYNIEKKIQNQEMNNNNNNNNNNTIASPFLHKKLTKRKSIIKSSESPLIHHIHSSTSSSTSSTISSSILTTNDLQDTHYRVIIRNHKETTCHLLPSSLVRDTIISLESMGQCERLESCFNSKMNQSNSQQKQKRRPLRSISSAIIHHATGSSSNINLSLKQQQQQQQKQLNDHSIYQEQTYSLIKLLHAAILTIYPNLDLRPFNTLTAEDTILAGLEKDLLHYDEIGIPKNYKFGILCVKDNQTTEEEWFSNTGLSKELAFFLNLIGRRVTLKNYNGYAAGLDIKCGESGEYSYVTSWRDNEIMFHVGPLMPLNVQDKQQVHRKRYIGNDIVCIIFMETDQQNIFDPSVIRSQFLHAFIIVHPEIVEEKQAWRVEIVYNKNMKEFGPSIPSPPLFFSEENLREFLILKLVSAEMSALQSDKFSIPNTKARQGILKTLLESGLAATNNASAATIHRSQTSSPINSFLRTKSGNNENKLKGGNYYQRPMSAGPAAIERQQPPSSSRASIQSLRGALDSPSPPPPLILPPQITSSISITSSPSSSTTHSSFLSRSLTPDQSLTTTSSSSTSHSPSSFFPNPSRSSMLRDIKSFTKRRHSTTSANNNMNHLINNKNKTNNKSRTTTPTSIDRTFHTESPFPICHSPISSSRLTMMESPISWITDKENSETNHSIEDLQQGQERQLRRETSISSFSSSTSSLNLNQYSSLNNNNNHHHHQYLSSSSSISLNNNSTYNLSSSPSPSETGNSSIRSRAQQLMSTVMLGRRKQSISRHFDQHQHKNNHHENNTNNSNSNNNNEDVSKLSRISKSKAILS